MATSAHSPAVELLAALERNELSSRELLDTYLERIDRYNPQLNAVVTLDREAARTAAAAADRARAGGADLGPLHGLPITIKDALLTRGLRSTGGDVALDDHSPEDDAPAVARLRAAGAIIFGKTNVPTRSGDSQTANAIFGRTHNPWDLDRSPGGSSGGAAVAIAAGLTAADLGTDFGGSVRIPASHCGVLGHKPSFGVVSTLGNLMYPGSAATERDMETVGPMGRRVADLALLLRVLVAPSRIAARPVPLARREPAGDLHLAAWFDEPGHAISAEVRAVYDRAVAMLEAAGASVDRAARPIGSLDRACELTVELAGAALSRSAPAANAQPGSTDPLSRGRASTHRQWLALDDERRRLRTAWGEFGTRYDAVLCPVSATVATPHDDQSTGTRLVDVDGVRCPETAGTAWNVVTTGLHLPATVVPAGLTPAGLPVGIMVVGGYLDDWTNLAVAQRIEAVLGAAGPPPEFDRAGHR